MLRQSFAAAALCTLAWVDASAANSSYAAVAGTSKLELDPAALDRARVDIQIQARLSGHAGQGSRPDHSGTGYF